MITCTIGMVTRSFTWHPREASLSELGDFYIGAAGAIAIIAGFAGVVVVFVYSSASPTFSSFRKTAEPELMRNWRTIVVSSFAGAGLFLAAALFNVIWSPVAAWFICLFGLAVAIDVTTRVIRQFSIMLRLSRIHDKSQKKKTQI